MSEEDKAVLCSCLYKELKFSRAESSIDGSAEIYLHTGEIGIEGFLEKEQKMEAYLDTFVMRGTDGSTLAIARCLETVGKY